MDERSLVDLKKWRKQMEQRVTNAEIRLARLEAQRDLMVQRLSEEERDMGEKGK